MSATSTSQHGLSHPSHYILAHLCASLCSFIPSGSGCDSAMSEITCAIGAGSLLVPGPSDYFSWHLQLQDTREMNPFFRLFPALIKLKCPCWPHCCISVITVFHSLWRQSTIQQTHSENYCQPDMTLGQGPWYGQCSISMPAGGQNQSVDDWEIKEVKVEWTVVPLGQCLAGVLREDILGRRSNTWFKTWMEWRL